YLAVNVPLTAFSRAARREKTVAEYKEEIVAAIEFLKRRKEIDKDNLFVMGHSMGADLACMVGGENKDIRATVAVGFPVDAAPEAPANLLIAVGLWDQLHSVSEMRTALRAATGGMGDRPGVLYGSMEAGTARKLVIFPLSDHPLEIFDQGFYDEALRWMNAASGREGRKPLIRMPYYMLAAGVGTAGGFGLILYLLIGLRGYLMRLLSANPFFSAFGRDRAVAFTVIVFILVLGLVHRSFPGPYHHALMLLLLLGAMVANFLGPTDGESLYPSFRKGFLLSFLHFSALAGIAASVQVMSNIPILVQHPFLLPQAPLFFPYALPMDIAVFTLKVSGHLFHGTADTTGVRPLLAVLLVGELFFPGRIVSLSANLFSRLLRGIRSLDFQIRFTLSPIPIIVLILLTGVAFVHGRQVLAAGYGMDAGETLRFAWLLTKLLLIPAILAVFVWRSAFFRRLESLILGEK
ncbi:MAG: hypothetical protein HYU64_01925, partial [Armatimonadetes bacterium]|nr:hypothetical protein [Armatimonadota bacterium]